MEGKDPSYRLLALTSGRLGTANGDGTLLLSVGHKLLGIFLQTLL